jgi:hypothetical protein
MSLALLATPAVSHPMTGLPVLADMDTPTPDPSTVTTTQPAPTDTTTTAPPTTSPLPPPPPPPAVHRAGVRVVADDVTIGSGYWSGSTGTSLSYRVTNTGSDRARVTVTITLPGGLTATDQAGCVSLGTHTLGCGYASLAAGATVRRSVSVRVDPWAWRSAPLGGVVSARATLIDWPSVASAHDQDGYAVLFPPGPPTPGIYLLVTDVEVDATGVGVLTVRLRNTGGTPAAARVDVTGPAGSRLATLDAECAYAGRGPNHRRCDIGTLAPGAQELLALRLTVNALAAGGGIPLGGMVRARLAPAGQDPVTTQASFRVLVAASGTRPATSASVGLAGAADTRDVATRAAPPAILPIDLSANPLAAVPIVGGLAGLVAVMCVLLVFGIRGRGQDLPPPVRPPQPVRPAIEAPHAES